MPPKLLADVQMRNVDLEARLIDDLLDLTRIVRGKLTLNPERCDVHQLIQSVATMHQSENQTRGLRLSMRLEADQYHVNADPARLQQVFWNVLKNATKFTPEGGSIDIVTQNDDSKVRLTVKDSGIGMSAGTLQRLFQPFEQGTEEIMRRYGGLGMGMAISKALIDAQGGSIDAASTGLGNGSSFNITIALPMR